MIGIEGKFSYCFLCCVNFAQAHFYIKECSLTVSKFLITSGFDGSNVTKSEIIDLSNSGNQQCPDWVDYSISVYGATSALIVNWGSYQRTVWPTTHWSIITWRKKEPGAHYVRFHSRITLQPSPTNSTFTRMSYQRFLKHSVKRKEIKFVISVIRDSSLRAPYRATKGKLISIFWKVSKRTERRSDSF